MPGPADAAGSQSAASCPRGSSGFGSPHQSGLSSLATPLGDPGPPPGLLTLASALPDSPGEAKPMTSLLAAEKPLRASLAPGSQVEVPSWGPQSPEMHTHRLPGRCLLSGVYPLSLQKLVFTSATNAPPFPSLPLPAPPAGGIQALPGVPARTGHIRSCPVSSSPRGRSRACLFHGHSLASSWCLVRDGGPANGCVLL